MKNNKFLYLIFVAFLSLSFVLTACGPTEYIVGSELICPLPYNPATDLSKCTVVQTQGEKYDQTTQQLLKSVYLNLQQVAFYPNGGETIDMLSYDILKTPGYHPVPVDYTRIYPTETRYVTANYKPAEECGGNNGINCLESMTNVILKGPKTFEASYVFAYTLNFSNQDSYKIYYEAATEKGLKGYDAFMTAYNDDFRNTLRASNNIDPTPWLDGTKSDGDIKSDWLILLANDPDMVKYKDLVVLDEEEFDVRYFKPVQVSINDQVQSNDILEEQEFKKFLERRDAFCGEFPVGSRDRLDCYATFVCYEVQCEAIVNNALVVLDAVTLEPTPEVTATP